MVRLPRRSEFLPRAPGLPPNRPYGPRSRRSDKMVTSAVSEIHTRERFHRRRDAFPPPPDPERMR